MARPRCTGGNGNSTGGNGTGGNGNGAGGSGGANNPGDAALCEKLCTGATCTGDTCVVGSVYSLSLIEGETLQPSGMVTYTTGVGRTSYALGGPTRRAASTLGVVATGLTILASVVSNSTWTLAYSP